MVISSYQINNVLRVYSDQLRQGRMAARPKNTAAQSPDRISISSAGKREAVIEKIASNIIDRITRDGPNEDIEKEVFKKLQTEYGNKLTVSRENNSELIFKKIDQNTETLQALSFEDSEFLSYKLKEITKETVGKNMF